MAKWKLLRQGYQKLCEGKPEQALECTKEILEKEPGCRRAIYLQALSLNDLGKSQEALFSVDTLLGERPAQDHVAHLIKAIIQFDSGCLEGAHASIVEAQLIAGSENPAVSGLAKIIHALGKRELQVLSELANSPSLYNEFVAPRLLLVLENEISRSKDLKDLEGTLWASYAEPKERSPKNKIAFYLGFWFLRFPVLLLSRLFGKPTMPLKAEAAYLRGDIEEARSVLQKSLVNGKKRKEKSYWLALLSFEAHAWRECLEWIGPEGEDENPLFTFMRGYCFLRLGKWAKSRRSLEKLVDSEPSALYFLGIALLRLGEERSARLAFTRLFHRDDLETAARITIAGRVLGLFPGDPNSPPFE